MDAHWLDGSAPIPSGDPALAIRFTTPSGPYVASRFDLGDGFQVNRLIFEQDPGADFTLSSFSGRTLVLTGTGAGIEHTGSAQVSMSSPLVLNPADDVVTIRANGSGALVLNSNLSGLGADQTLRIESNAVSPNGPIISVLGTNSIAGTVEIHSGNVRLGDNALGNAKLRISGGTIRLFDTKIENEVELASDLVLAGSGNGYISGVISSVAPTAGLTVRNAPGSTVTLVSPSTYTGKTAIDFDPTSQSPFAGAGTLRVLSDGSILNSSAIHVRSGGTLLIETVNTGVTDRVGDETPIHLEGGKLVINAFQGGAAIQQEQTGAISLSGFNTIYVGPQLRNVDLSVASLSRPNRGTVIFSSPTLPGGAASSARILFDTAPSGLVGGGGSGPDTSIIPYAVGMQLPTGDPQSFVTYDPSSGIRMLNTATDYVTTLGGAASTNNVRIGGSETLVTAATVNSLIITGTAEINGTGPLTVTSGAILASGPTSQTFQFNVPLTFGSAEAQFFTVGNLAVNQPISGTNGLTKSGSGMLLLQSANPFSGPLTINAGSIGFSALDQLGSDTGAITLHHTGGLAYLGEGSFSLTRPLELGSGFAELASSNIGSLNVDAVISGSGALRITGGTVSLNATNTHAGPTVITGGTLQIDSDAAFGSGELWIGSTLRLMAPWNTTRPINVIGGTIDTNGFDATIAAPIAGLQPLQKEGTGSLILTTDSSFRGDLEIQSGTVIMQGAGSMLSSMVRIHAGAALELNHAGTGSPRLARYAEVRLAGGTLRLSNAGSGLSREEFRTLQLSAAATEGSGNVISLSTTPGSTVTLSTTEIRGSAAVLLVGDRLAGASGSDYQRVTMPIAPTAIEGLVPRVYAAESSGSEENLVTYDSTADAGGTIGFRSLGALDYLITALLENPATPVSSHTLIAGAATANGNDNTIRSLVLNAGGTLTLGASQTVRVTSGQILARSGLDATSITGGAIDFGSHPGTVATFGDLALDSAVSGDGWTKVGPGTLSLGFQPPGAAPLTIAEGRVRLLDPMALAAQTVTMTERPVTLEADSQDSTVGGLNGLGTVVIGDKTLTVGTAGSEFNFNGTFLGTGNIRIVDGGNSAAERTLWITSAADRAAITLESGTLQYNDANKSNPTPLTLAGGILLGSSDWRVPLVITGEAQLRSNMSIRTPATITGPGSLHVGSSSLNLFVDAEHAGETVVLRSGRLVLQPGAELPNTSAIHIRAGELSFTADEGNSDRINDGAPIHIRGGTLNVGNPAGESAAENVGTIHAGPGSKVRMVASGTSSGDDVVLELRPSEIVRANHGVLTVESSQMTDPGAVVRTQLIPNAALATIGGGAPTGPNTSIIPWIISRGAMDDYRSTFTTYDPATGIRALDLSSDYAQSLGAVSEPTNNLRFSGTDELQSSLTVNSLLLHTGNGMPNLNGDGTLTVTSGVVLVDGPAHIRTPLHFGTAEALFIAGGDTYVWDTISGTGGLIKTGSGSLTLNGNNTYTGPTRIIESPVFFAMPTAFGSDPSPIELDGASLNYTGSGPATFDRAIAVSELGGIIQNIGDAGPMTLTNGISGSGRVAFGGRIHLTGNNTYTGDTDVTGHVTFDSDAAFGIGGAIHINSGILEPTFDWVTGRTIRVSSGGQFSTGANAVTFNGPLIGANTFTKYGAGTLRLNDVTEFHGRIVAGAGTLEIFGSIGTDDPDTSVDVIESGVGAVITGEGVWDRHLVVKGTLAPGNGVGRITALDVMFYNDATLALEIASAENYDQLGVRGQLSLGDWVNLAIDLQYDPVDWVDTFVIVDNDGSDPVDGFGGRVFRWAGNDLPEGSVFSVGDQKMKISYVGGDGNDVVLMAVPEPGSAALLLSSLGLAACRFRRRAMGWARHPKA